MTPTHVGAFAIRYSCFRRGNDVKPGSEKVLAEWADDNRQTWARRRDWHGRYRLGALCVLLLFAGFAASHQLGSWPVATICGIGSAASFVTMLRRGRDRRYFITRQSSLQGYRDPARTPWWRR